MELQNLEKQRLRKYKEEIKQEMDRQLSHRKEQNTYQRKKENKNHNQLINLLNENDMRRLEERKHTEMLLKEHNTGMGALKKSHSMWIQQGQQRGNSFTQNISNHDLERMDKIKSELQQQKVQNSMQEKMKKKNEDSFKNHQRIEQFKHLQRLKEREEESKKNYNEINRRHAQNMKLYKAHSSLMEENQQYKKLGQKFTQCQQDILSHLHRDQYTQRMKNIKQTQDVLKNQMGQYKQKRFMEKSQILEKQQLEKSLFKALLHDDTYDKKLYANELKHQMSQVDYRKQVQQKNLKQKYQIKGIFGGQHDRERQYQIRYMDRKPGLNVRQNRTTFNIQNGEEDPTNKSIKMQTQEIMSKIPKRLRMSYNKEEGNGNYQINNQTAEKEQNYDHKDSAYSNKFKVYGNNPPEMRGESEGKGERRVFRSFDFVTGKNRYFV